MTEMSENRWSDVITSEDGDYVGVDEADDVVKTVLRVYEDALQKTQAENARLRGRVADLEELNRGCICQSCGEEFREDVGISNALWDRIRPEGKPAGGGLLCGRCIGERIDKEIAARDARIAELETILKEICDGNDLAAERGVSVTNWTGSYLSRKARAALAQDPKEVEHGRE